MQRRSAAAREPAALRDGARPAGRGRRGPGARRGGGPHGDRVAARVGAVVGRWRGLLVHGADATGGRSDPPWPAGQRPGARPGPDAASSRAVARPQPLRRLLDGRPDDPGRRIARRTTLLMVPAIVGANFTGAVVVFALVTWVLPLPDVEDRDTLLLVNLLAATAYVAVACVIGTVWGLARWRATRNWLERDRE